MTRAFTIASLLLVLSGCEQATRECPEFFNPVAEEFSTIDIGETMRFSASTGAVVDFELLSIENNEPYTAAERGASGDVSRVECRLESAHAYYSRELDLELDLNFRHIENPAVAPLEQVVSLDIVFRKRVTGNQYLLRFFLSDYERTIVFDEGGSIRYDASRSFGNDSFSEVSEVTEPLTAFVFDDTVSSTEVRIFRVALSRGVGLVEYEQVDGTTYTRLLP